MTKPINFEIEQGATFKKSIFWREQNGEVIPLVGYTAKMQIRASVTSPTVLAEISTTPSSVGSITISPNDGGIHLHITDETTAEFVWSYGVYDVFVYAPGAPSADALRVIGGRISVVKTVTKPT